MPAWLIVILSILAVVLVAFIVLLILGGRLQKKANSQQEALASAAQTVSMLIIDKKKLKISEANLPKVVTDQVPKYARRAKFPIVKAALSLLHLRRRGLQDLCRRLQERLRIPPRTSLLRQIRMRRQTMAGRLRRVSNKLIRLVLAL